MFFSLLVLISLNLWAESSDLCGTGLEAFKSTIHPELIKSCSNCHGEDSDLPQHAHDDAQLAYQAAKPLADFNQIERSQFIQMVRSKHWLRTSSRAKGMSEEKMRELLSAWYEAGEKDCTDRHFQYVSEFVEIPQNDNFQSVTLKVSEDVSIQLDVQKYIVEGDGLTSWRLKKPRLMTKKDVEVTGLGIIIDGETHPLENAFEKIKQFVFGKEWTQDTIQPFPVLSTESLITIPRKVNQPKFAIGI
jgi:hypothetical protein